MSEFNNPFANKKSTTAAKAAPRKAARKVEEPIIIEAQATEVPETDTEETHAWHEFMENIKQAQDALYAKIKAPTWARQLTALLLAMFAYCGIAYNGMILAQMLMIIVALGTSSAFLAFFIGMLGYLIVLVAAMTVGTHVYKFAMAFELSNVTNTAKSVSNRVRGWFNSSDEVQHA